MANANSPLERMSGESDFQYHRRIVYGKLVDKTLQDYDYSELARYVYGKEYASDVARRMMYGSRNTLDLLSSERERMKADSALTEDVNNKIKELKMMRQQFYDQRREYNKLISIEGRTVHLYDRLAEAAENLKDDIGCIFGDKLSDDLQYSENEAVLVLSDWHYGMMTDNVFNSYNTDICQERVTKVVRAAASRIRNNGCSKLHIAVLGDLFHGAIHTSARVASEELVCDQIMQVSEILAQAIGYLSQFVKETFVYMTYGNHCRTVAKKEDNVHRDNLERLIPWWLKQRLSSSDNVFIVPDSQTEFILINAAGHDLCASHGDLDSIRSSPRLLTSVIKQRYDKNIEYILLGDKHHAESFEELGVTAMMCGALCGADDYANEKRLYSVPSQLLLIFNKEDGLDAVYRLKCE